MLARFLYNSKGNVPEEWRHIMRKPTKAVAGTMLGAPVIFSFLADGSLNMCANSAVAFAVALSLLSMAVIAGAAFMGAYKFLRNVGLFKGHYYY
jgi:hypothetical protein